MKPVAIFRHSPTEGPGHFATYLDGRRIPWTLLKLDEGEAVRRVGAHQAAVAAMRRDDALAHREGPARQTGIDDGVEVVP